MVPKKNITIVTTVAIGTFRTMVTVVATMVTAMGIPVNSLANSGPHLGESADHHVTPCLLSSCSMLPIRRGCVDAVDGDV